MYTMRPTIEDFAKLTSNPSSIRNVCILAHVDHGKTTIADSLLAMNGLVSQRLAGQVRYLDDRQDEQLRGITMKSSAVSLFYPFEVDHMVLNLIDTPGHIDFSTEVAAAVRICDGALIVVDLVEGVCVQTREAIKQAYEEHVKMILVLNKMDRLIVELHKTIDEIFQTILRVIEDCNVTIAELCRFDITNDEEEEQFLFSPDRGNVIFASAIEGWGVTTKIISEMFVELLVGETIESLNQKMWNFDYYVDSVTKRVVLGAIDKKKENLFIQLFLKTIHFVYYTFVTRMQRDKVPIVLKKLKIANATREMNHTNPRIQVKAILQAWSPIAEAIMIQCYDVVPSPADITEKKLRYLVSNNRYHEKKELNECVENMISEIKSLGNQSNCSIYISKMFSVNKKNLSQNKPKFTPIRPRNVLRENTVVLEVKPEKPEPEKKEVIVEIDKTQENVIVALGRVFSGSLKIGDEVYVLNSNFDPTTVSDDLESYIAQTDSVMKVIVKELYMILGKELVLTEKVSFGNICGIGGLEELVTRTSTLSSTLRYLPFSERSLLEPIVRNTIEPENPKNLQKLRQGLKLLMQSDSCVQVVMQETGEQVLVTAGDVHLAKCLEDLKNKFIDFEINVSKPMVSLRETIINLTKRIDITQNLVTINIREFGMIMDVVVAPLPVEISNFVKTNYNFLRMVEEHQQKMDIDVSLGKTFLNEHTKFIYTKLKDELRKIFKSAGPFWTNYYEKIWSVGKMRDSINLLFNNTDYKGNLFSVVDEGDPRSQYDNYIVNGFEICCRAGPISEEPLINCAFFVNAYKLDEADKSDSGVQIVANIPLIIKTGFREAFLKQPQRLMEPIFTTDIQVNTSILGKVYSVVNKRHGKVLDAVGMDDQEKIFMVKAQIPVIECDGFANEIRKTTSGQANPNLRFSHYEIVDGDPYYEEEIEEEDEESNAADAAIRANRLMKEIRRRKGLLVDDQVVVHAEKQRTLNKKK